MKVKQRTGVRRSLCLLLIIGFLPIGCGEKVQPGTARVKRPVIRGVSVAAVVPRRIDEFTEATGTVRAARAGYVASRMMGTVTSILVREGDRVAKGQLLLTIDDSDVVQKVKAAEAGSQEAARAFESAGRNRELADVTYGRYKKMYDEKAISQQEMDQFAAGKQVAGLEQERMREMQKRAAAVLAEAKVTLGFTRVTSPFAGQVTEKKIDVGSMAVPGMPLLTVEDASGFNAEISVDEQLAGRITVGVPVTVDIESINRQIAGRITRILPTVDPESRTFIVKVSVSGAGLRSGLYARVKIPRGTAKEVILAPRTALVDRGQLTGVYTVDDRGVVTYRLVRTGKEYGGDREILSGLKPKERIIVHGVEKAVDGGIVEKGNR
jgi:RND family efflux transporter MFP subunit